MKASEQSPPSGSAVGGGLLARALAAARWLVREPLVHFVVAGGLLFALVDGVADQRSRHRIEFGPRQMAHIREVYRMQYGAEPDSTEFAALKADWLRAEIMAREAGALGLDRDDEIIRRRLIQKYEFLEQDTATLQPPTQQQLAAYYRAHAQAYAEPAQQSFEQRYFSVDRDGEAGARARASAALAALRSDRPAPSEDIFSGPATYADIDRAGIERVFGGQGFSDSLFAAPVGAWSGPFRSGLGWHIVLVHKRDASRSLPFASVEDRVREDYLGERRRRASEEAFARLQARYTIVEGDEGEAR